ncbi:hypothetical protein E2562_033201 [Oryza meyeriana var. granulata]|uniref:Uncharacterized protein n=1 Tax=Oryza meyeriana var. granulata TaxID=110450 RepID=A0A6G1DRN6_9ORYZ|nr:hypothetical protein E2562_033201 [Oryza meyeriana var. granulata]
MCGASLVQAEARLEATTARGHGSPGADAGVGRVAARGDACGWIAMGRATKREGEVWRKEGGDLRVSWHGGSGRQPGAMDRSGGTGLGICVNRRTIMQATTRERVRKAGMEIAEVKMQRGLRTRAMDNNDDFTGRIVKRM